MTTQALAAGLDLFALDATGQTRLSVKSFPRTGLVRDLVSALIPQLGLNTRDANGRPMEYQAFSRREAIHLRGSETLNDVVQSGDEISLLPDIQAG